MVKFRLHPTKPYLYSASIFLPITLSIYRPFRYSFKENAFHAQKLELFCRIGILPETEKPNEWTRHMLNDRSYMRRGPGGPDYQDVVSGRKALFSLILINIGIYLLFPPSAQNTMALSMDGIRHLQIYQLVTAMFVHANFSHLFCNMLSLYIFGSLSAPILGAGRFLKMYFFAGILGNLLWVLTALSSGDPSYLVGASGAIMGVIVATAMMLPNIEMMMLFFPIPFKLRTLAIVFILIELFNQISIGRQSNIAYLCHIGGFIGGYLYMVLFQRQLIQWNPLSFLSGNSSSQGSFRASDSTTGARRMPHGWSFGGFSGSGRKTDPGARVTQKELDYLLDKISREGINSLSEEEMARLELAREQMRGK